MIADCPRCGVRQNYYEGKKCFNCELTKIEAFEWVKKEQILVVGKEKAGGDGK